jgi:hypothetical protein
MATGVNWQFCCMLCYRTCLEGSTVALLSKHIIIISPIFFFSCYIVLQKAEDLSSFTISSWWEREREKTSPLDCSKSSKPSYISLPTSFAIGMLDLMLDLMLDQTFWSRIRRCLKSFCMYPCRGWKAMFLIWCQNNCLKLQ